MYEDEAYKFIFSSFIEGTCPEKDIVMIVNYKFMYSRNLSHVKNDAFKQNYVHVSSLSIHIIVLGNVLKDV